MNYFTGARTSPELKKPSIIIILTALFLYFLVSGTNLIAQERGILRGFVADSLTAEALPYANVLIKELNRGATTDSRGFFVMASLPNKRLTVVISYIGYRSKQFIVDVEPYIVTNLRALLPSTNIQMRTIESTGDRIAKENATDLSLQRIAIRDLENLPKGVELDIFRSLQTMPGVQTGGDVSARFYVRGSPSNENLVLLDNTTIYNPYHALGIFSAIDPDMISSMEFYKGGFPAEYTHRLSSVLKVVTKDGNKNSFGGKAAISLLTAKLMLEGPIPSGSFIISGRKNYSDVILKKFRNNNSIPADFYDLFAKVNYSDNGFMQDAKFSVSMFRSSDKILNDNPKREDFTWDNSTFAFNYFQVSDSPLFYQLDLSLSTFNGERIPNYSGAKGLKNELTDFTMRVDFNYVYDSKDELGGGFKLTEVHTNLILENFRGQSTNTNTRGVSVSAYAKYKILRSSIFGADVGARAHATRFAGGGSSVFLEPKTSFTLRFIPEIAIKGSWGIYMQDIVTVSDENEVVSIFEPWIITPLYLNPSSAIHYIGGLEITPAPNFSMNIESYYKIMHDLAIVNDQKFFETDPDLISGSGRSYGVEFETKYQLDPFKFTGSYAWMRAFKDVRGKVYSPRYDSRSNVNLSLEAELGSGWAASAVWSYTTGLPFTQIAGYYDRLTTDQLADSQFLLDSYNPFVLLGEMNTGQLPDYHRLDLSLSKKIQIDRLRMYIDISVLNVYNRNNLFYFRRDTGERVNMLPFLPSVNFKVEL
ncbi:MAG: TonB-dependent receptor [Melioribacteraceae bacterium]